MLDIIAYIVTPIELLSVAIFGTALGFTLFPWFWPRFQKWTPTLLIEILGVGFLLIVLASTGEKSPEAIAIIIGLSILWTTMTLFIYVGEGLHELADRYKWMKKINERIKRS